MSSLENYFAEIEKILRKDVEKSYVGRYQSIMIYEDYIKDKIRTEVSIAQPLVSSSSIVYLNKDIDDAIKVVISTDEVEIVSVYYTFHYDYYQKEMSLEDFHSYVKQFTDRLKSGEWLKDPESTKSYKPANRFAKVQIDNPENLMSMVEAFAALEFLKMNEDRRASVYVDEDGKAHASIRITEDGKIEAYFLLLETPFHEKDFRKERKLRSFSEIVKLSQKWGTEI